MTTWTHKGITITLTIGGEFVATIAGKHNRAPSLDAMKKRIDIAAETAATFTPFKFIDYDNEGKIVGGTVTGIRWDGVGRHRKRVFVTEGGWRHRGSPNYVTPDTPEARDAIKRYAASAKARDEAQEAMDKARAAIPQRKAADA